MSAAAAERTPAFAPVGAGARMPPLWAQPLVLVLLFALAGLVLVAATFGIGTFAALTGRFVDPALFERWWAALGLTVILFAALSAITLVWVRKVERRSWASVGLVRFRPGDLAWCVVGAIWAAVLAGCLLALAGEALVGGAVAAGPATLSRAVLVTGGSLLIVAVLATTEEVVFRGWALSAVATRLGRVWALGLTSAAFGAAHVFPWEWADPARLLSLAGFVAMGVAFGVVALKRGSLWSSAAFHAGYNGLLVVAGAWAVGFEPSLMWESVGQAGSGFDSLRGAAVLAGAQTLMAAGVVVWWRRSARS